MAFLDHKGESEFPFSKDTVFEAICTAIALINGMKIYKVDKLQGRIYVKAGVSLSSWGENIPIQLMENGENKTKVIINSSPKTGILMGGAFDLGKNNKNIEQILNMTSSVLQSFHNKTGDKSNNSGIASTTESNNQNYMTIPPPSRRSRWYDSKLAVHILLIVFFPVGLYALWKNSNIALWWKAVATVIVLFFVVSVYNAEPPTNTDTIAANVSVGSAIQEEDEPDKIVSSINDLPKTVSIGETVSVGNFTYKIQKTRFAKSIGDSYSLQEADGIYLLITLSITNVSNESRTLDNSLFKLTDEQGIEYESSNDGTMALEMSSVKTLFLKQCQPNIPTTGTLVFEVPDKKGYDLHLSGGFWNGETVVAKIQ